MARLSGNILLPALRAHFVRPKSLRRFCRCALFLESNILAAEAAT
jgi:hypothetical protein